MVPLTPEVAAIVVGRATGGPRRGLALRHALRQRRPGLWGDHPRRPSCVLWLRPGIDQWEAFAEGPPEPAAVTWITARPGPIALLAPGSWEGPVRVAVRAEGIERVNVETWRIVDDGPDAGGGSADPGGWSASTPRAALRVRRLVPGDAAAFEAAAPGWALRAWGTFGDLIATGAAFGVPTAGEGGFAALAWIVERDGRHDALGVFTDPRFRRLGLGRAAVGALLKHVAGTGDRRPLWFVSPGNVASRGLARSLGFSPTGEEPMLRWGGPGAGGARGRASR